MRLKQCISLPRLQYNSTALYLTHYFKIRASAAVLMIVVGVSVGSLKLSWLSFALVVVAERKESSRDDRK